MLMLGISAYIELSLIQVYQIRAEIIKYTSMRSCHEKFGPLKILVWGTKIYREMVPPVSYEIYMYDHLHVVHILLCYHRIPLWCINKSNPRRMYNHC